MDDQTPKDAPPAGPADPGQTLDSGAGPPLAALATPTLSGRGSYTTRPHDDGAAPIAWTPPLEVAFAADRSDGDELGRGASVGRYLILSLLGRGGAGEVYQAYDPELDRKVALKLLHTARGSSVARRLLVREARALGKLSHPNVVQVHDVGEHQGDVFVAMELVDGEPLDVWARRTPKPGFREALAVYLDAARGLSAAHDTGLVHRDVKPSNILRGKDGRVRVVDFGLAAAHDGARAASAAEDLEDERAPSANEERLTRTGTILGTPLYMAPEQHEGPRVSAASDQYSLCVALHEALAGAPPFLPARTTTATAMLEDLRAKKLAGPPPPPARSDVPPWVWRAVRRGLSPKPEDRFPSLPALIEALSDDPEARGRPRWQKLALGAAGAAVVMVAGAAWSRGAARRDPCAHPEQQLAGVWDEPVKARVRAAFTGSGRAHGEGTATRVAAILDRYAGEWAAMRGEVCEARRADKQRALADLRDLCLGRRLAELRALTFVFGDHADPQIVDRAVQAASGLYPVATCADAEALTARVRPPEDPAVRERVVALQPRVDRVAALFAAGEYKQGVALGGPLHAEVAGVPYPPLRAQAAFWMGRLHAEGTGDYEASKALLREAIVAASEGRDDVLAADAWGRLLGVVGDLQQKLEEAAVIRGLGPAAIARAGDDRATAAWLHAEGQALVRLGKPAEGKVFHERALALREKILGPDHPDVAASLAAVANALWAMGDYPRSREVTERALVLREKILGPDHPELGKSMNNLASVLAELGEYRRALELRERTLALREKTLGPDHPEVGSALNNLGTLLFAIGEYRRSASTHERALSVRTRSLGPEHAYISMSLVNLADVYMRTGDPQKALDYSLRGLAISEKARGAEHPDLCDPLTNAARAEVRVGKLGDARAHLDRAIRLVTRAHGPSHPLLADPLLGLGELHLARNEPAEAVLVLERSLALAAAGAAAEARLALADALLKSGGDRSRARALAEEARAFYERVGHHIGAERAARWLAEHP